jgi:hypothetical protein
MYLFFQATILSPHGQQLTMMLLLFRMWSAGGTIFPLAAHLRQKVSDFVKKQRILPGTS